MSHLPFAELNIALNFEGAVGMNPTGEYAVWPLECNTGRKPTDNQNNTDGRLHEN